MIDKLTGRWIPDFMGQQPWQDRELMAMIQQQTGQGPVAHNNAAQPLKPVTIQAEIIQFTDPAEVLNYQMSPGSSQMFMSKDEMLIIIREQGQNGYSLKHYPMRQPEPPAPAIDPAQFVTWDRLEERLAQLAPAPSARRAVPKGDEK